MAELFNITHDADNLDEYDSTVTDGGDLSTSTPGLASTTAKMQALIDDANAIYGQVNISPPASNKLRIRVYGDPNGCTMESWAGVHFLQVRLSGSPYNFAYIFFQANTAPYYVKAIGEDDGGGDHATNTYEISDDEHYFEIYIVRASDDVSADGTLSLWIDGAFKETVTGIDNWDAWALINGVRAGAPSPWGTISGTIYLDDLKANDDGTEIGPVSAAGQPIHLRATTVPHMRQWQPRVAS